jgi:hypothetical protein
LPHFAASDGFAVYKKAALQLSIRVIRVIRGQITIIAKQLIV